MMLFIKFRLNYYSVYGEKHIIKVAHTLAKTESNHPVGITLNNIVINVNEIFKHAKKLNKTNVLDTL